MMSSFEVAAVITGLKYAPQWLQRRTQIAQYLRDRSVHACANDFDLEQNTFSKLVFQNKNRDSVVDHFKNLNIDCPVHYNLLVADETIYTSNNSLSNSQYLRDISFTVPNQHTLTDSEVETIAKALT
jgi:dTDP-4-amino-4,6-dideoxygalactose transaminase